MGNKKTQENPRSNFYTFSDNFWKKATLFLKNVSSSAKISDDLFFSRDDSDFEINVFSGKLKKNQEKPKVLSKTLEKTQGPQKKTQEPKIVRKTQDLGRKPKQWQRWTHNPIIA